MAPVVPPVALPLEDTPPPLAVDVERVVPAEDVFAEEEMLVDVLVLNKTFALVSEVDNGESWDVELTLEAADVVLILPDTRAEVAEAAWETPAVLEGLKSALPGEATTPDPAPEEEPAVFDTEVEDTPLDKEDWM